MGPKEAADEIRRLLRDELGAVESALAVDDIDAALGPLSDAIRKLKRIANELED